jgi:hypothetical protein
MGEKDLGFHPESAAAAQKAADTRSRVEIFQL